MTPVQKPLGLTTGLRVILGLLGGGSFALGILGVFLGNDGAGTAVLIAFGGILLVLALLGDRIEALEIGGTRLRLRRAAEELFRRADESEYAGDVATAERLRTEGRALLEAAGVLADAYLSTRRSMPSGPERTRALEGMVASARRLAEQDSFNFKGADVLRWLREGDEGQRVMALGMMQVRRDWRDFDAVLRRVEQASSAFEQYHAMLVMVQMVAELDPRQRQRLARVVRDARGRDFAQGSDRWHLSEAILRQIGTGETAGDGGRLSARP